MSLVTRYFSTAAAGTGDGTSWANRAVLFTGGAWSSVITGFNFGSTDSLLCLIGPGTYAITTVLQTATFTVASPTTANPILLHGCDSSGNLLTPPSPGWTSDQPAWDDTALPVLATTTNTSTLGSSLPGCIVRLLKFTATGITNRAIAAPATLDWVSVVTSTAANTSPTIGATANVTNCIISVQNTTYDAVLNCGGAGLIDNNRISAVTGSSGNRDGVVFTSTTSLLDVRRCTVLNVGGHGIVNRSTSTGQATSVSRNVVRGCGGDGIRLPSTASQTNIVRVLGNHVSGCGGVGINAQSAANVMAAGNRSRDNVGGDLVGFGNYPTTFDNNTSAGTDATEFVSTGTGDYRIKSTAAIWGKGYGVSDQAAASGFNSGGSFGSFA